MKRLRKRLKRFLKAIRPWLAPLGVFLAGVAALIGALR